jgi:RND family efflux transporter MFP subunit
MSYYVLLFSLKINNNQVIKRNLGIVLLFFFSIVFQQAVAQSDLKTYVIELETITKTQTFNGIVEAVKESTLSSEISGKVLEVNFDVDDVVKEGDILLRVYSGKQKSNVSKLQANLRVAKSRYSETSKQFKRINKLYKNKQISASSFDTAKQNNDSAKANIDMANAALSTAKENLKLTTVTAPYDGVVTERYVEVGETTNPGKPLLTGFSLDHFRISVDIPQRLNSIIREKQKVSVSLTEQQFTAEKLTIFPYANKYTGTIKVRIDVPSSLLNKVFPGMYAKVDFELGKQQVLMLPKQSLVSRGEVSAVYVVSDQGIGFRAVRVGQLINDKFVVLSGLSVNEKIALDPLQAGIALKKSMIQALIK